MRMPLGWTIGFFIIALAADAALAGPFAVVAGRRDPRIIVIDLDKALQPGNNGTPNAVLARVRVTRDVDTDGDGAPDVPAAGLPSSVVVAPDGRTAFVVNHAGNATPAAVNGFQHGHLGTVAVVDLAAVLATPSGQPAAALKAVIPTGYWGPVGLALTRGGKVALVTNSESDGKEDGAREISVVDLDADEVVRTFALALGDGGRVAQEPGHSCPELAADRARLAKSLPHPSFGCFPASNAIGIVRRRSEFAFTANGGTDDVSVVDVDRVLAGDARAEVGRIRVELGPWGLAVSPDGALVAVTNRESAEVAREGNTISLIDVERAIAGAAGAEVARVLVGTLDPAHETRPFGLAFTPDGRRIVVANFRANDVSVVDVAKALAAGVGGAGAEVARIPLMKPGGGPARPRGVAVTADGRFAVVSGGGPAAGLPLGGNGAFCERVAPVNACGALWIIDLGSNTVAATVTGVGNEPYLVDVTAGPRR